MGRDRYGDPINVDAEGHEVMHSMCCDPCGPGCVQPGEVHPAEAPYFDPPPESDFARKLRELRAARKRASMRRRIPGSDAPADWHYRERRIQGWGVAALMAFVASFIVTLLVYVYISWPSGQY